MGRKVSVVSKGRLKDAYPARVCAALLQLHAFRCRNRSRKDGEDEGEQREQDTSESEHREAGRFVKGEKGAKVSMREKTGIEARVRRDATVRRRDRGQKPGSLLYGEGVLT